MSKRCTLGQAKGSHTAIIGGGERTLPDSTSGRVAGNKGTVDNILSNEKYIGDAHILKSDEDSQSYLMQDSHQAIIDRSSFQAVQLEKKSRSNIEKSVDGKHRKSKNTVQRNGEKKFV